MKLYNHTFLCNTNLLGATNYVTLHPIRCSRLFSPDLSECYDPVCIGNIYDIYLHLSKKDLNYFVHVFVHIYVCAGAGCRAAETAERASQAVDS